MTPEEQARVNIDKLLEQSGWLVQDYKHLNLGASLGIAVREFPTLKGPADYMLFIKRKAVGVLEVKSEGVTLRGVTEQSERYLRNFPDDIPHITPLRFAYESIGVETIFRDRLDINKIIKRDNTNLDIFWLKDESVEDSANLPEPKVLIEDILENLEYVKSEFEEIYEELNK